VKSERSRVNLANQITIFRILLIPVFIGLVIYYGDSARGEHPNEALRLWAAAVFGIASISDAIDGWIARRFNQRTRFGAIMDPLADKLLMLSAIILLSFTSWRQHFPLWFPILVIGRDLLSIGGAFLIDHFAGKFQIHTHWTGKTATFAQMAAILWILLDLKPEWLIWPTLFAATFTALSGFLNLADGVKQLQAAGHD
jgi:CDP-diacylglycerol--glycerol-3-phosphate 3-phosphatidyltransferase/cardiolipin synthase